MVSKIDGYEFKSSGPNFSFLVNLLGSNLRAQMYIVYVDNIINVLIGITKMTSGGECDY